VQPYEGIKTGIGRARAFLRLALMQKKLPDYLDLLQSSDQSFRATFWEDWSLIRNDEAPEIFGHMQGLSIGTVLNTFYSNPNNSAASWHNSDRANSVMGSRFRLRSFSQLYRRWDTKIA